MAKSNKILLLVSTAMVFMFAGCGGGGSSSSGSDASQTDNNGDVTQPILRTISGKVIDGPIANATICLDENKDFTCQTQEYRTLSDNDGSFTLSFPQDADETLNIIAYGGTDTFTKGPYESLLGIKLSLLNSQDSAANIIAPISTLISSLSEDDFYSYSIDSLKPYLHKDPTQDVDTFVINQEILTAFAFYVKYEEENGNTITDNYWTALRHIAIPNGYLIAIDVPDYETKLLARNFTSQIKLYATEPEDFAVVQNYVAKFIESVQKLGTGISTKNMVEKLLVEKKVVTLATPQITAFNHYNFVQMRWSAVKGATAYEVYDGNSKILTTTNPYADIAYPYNKSTLNLSVMAVNSYEISPEAFVSFSKGATNDYVPAPINVTASKDQTNQIQVCFDYPVYDTSEVIDGSMYYYKFSLYAKDNNLSYRSLNWPTDLALLFKVENTDSRFDRYCFAPVKMTSTDIIKFYIAASGIKVQYSPRATTQLPSSSTQNYPVYGYTAAEMNNTTLNLQVYGGDDTALLKWDPIKGASKYTVYLSEKADFSNPKALVETYANTISFALPYVYLNDTYYLRVAAVTPGGILLSPVRAYSYFNTRNTLICGTNLTNGIPYLSIGSYYNMNGSSGVAQTIYYKSAINQEIFEPEKTFSLYAGGFNTIGINENGDYVEYHFPGIDYSQSVRATFFEIGQSYEGWALGHPYIIAQCNKAFETGDQNNYYDDDRDGVVNSSDTCLLTQLGEEVGANGCSVADLSDSDGDSVQNYLDLCPLTGASYAVNSDGCAAYQLNDFDNDKVDNTLDACPNATWDYIEADYSGSTPLGCSPAELSDEDSDGVIAYNDRCPSTKATETADAEGCSSEQLTDSDSDGVFDTDDVCPNTPSTYKTNINFQGCYGAEVSDQDGDAVVDLFDQCPHTPAPLIGSVDTTGCAYDETHDDDGDSIFNYADACPETPTGNTISQNGCTIPATLPAIDFTKCQRPVLLKPYYEVQWEPNTMYDGYEILDQDSYFKPTFGNSLYAYYPYLLTIKIRPYYVPRQNGTFGSKFYGPVSECDLGMGSSVARYEYSEPISFTLYDNTVKEMQESTVTTSSEQQDTLNSTSTIANEGHMFVFKYNNYWWGAGPCQQVYTGYATKEEVIDLVKGSVCREPRRIVQNVSATTQNGNHVEGDFFYCGQPLVDDWCKNLDIYTLYDFD